MSAEACLALLADMLRTVALVAGPILLASLLAGLLVGVVQTATQVNEPSISYLVKAAAVAAVMLSMGAALAWYATTYARRSFQAVATVVHS
jgi:flagellar biosynthetic protein FliQ